MLASTAAAALAQPNWDDHRSDSRYFDSRYDSKDLRRDYDKLRDIDRRIENDRREKSDAEYRRDWRRVRHEEDEIARLYADRRRVERDIERDLEKERARDRQDYWKRDRRDWDRRYDRHDR